MRLGAEVVGGQHDQERAADGTCGVGKKRCDARERFLILRIKDMRDGANEQRVGGLFQVVPAFSFVEHQSQLGMNAKVFWDTYWRGMLA
jgi:hypothetical protein